MVLPKKWRALLGIARVLPINDKSGYRGMCGANRGDAGNTGLIKRAVARAVPVVNVGTSDH